MTTVAIDLGSVKVTSTRSAVSLVLSSSFSVTLPPRWSRENTAVELCTASRAGDIWVSKAGVCRIGFLARLPDGLDAGPALKIVHQASECRVWNDLGLELKSDYSPTAACDAMRASYFLHHPDLSSSAIVAGEVPVAQFQGLQVEFSIPVRSGISGPSDQTRPELNASGTPASRAHTYSLRCNPRPTKRFLDALDASIPIDPGPNLDTSEHDLVCLLDAGLRRLIGVRGGTPGVRTSRGKAFPSLVDIAPAVWNLPYLQSMAVHAQVIPVLARGMSRLAHARSATLREKVARLGMESANRYEPCGVGDDIQNEARKRLWLLCQTRIRASPMQKAGNRKTEAVESVETSQVSPPDDTFCGDELGYHHYSIEEDFAEHESYQPVEFPEELDYRYPAFFDDSEAPREVWNQEFDLWDPEHADIGNLGLEYFPAGGEILGLEETDVERGDSLYLDGQLETASAVYLADENLQMVLPEIYNTFGQQHSIAAETDPPVDSSDTEADYFWADGKGGYYLIEDASGDDSLGGSSDRQTTSTR
ncbi:hypothetical protein QBC47DRAFT_428862 [Echria macrotheca]|uniref:Uncharacterized protein n=1 Tax=Echria macrotheca TaxID=438768 RepID=A0AAJ0BQ81_9PEZI|nr:hypothetical protein QBC47DRAFT_428862 [Echria macrotheca]